MDTKGKKEGAQRKREQRKDPGESPRKPHYLRFTLKLQIKELEESRNPRRKNSKEKTDICREIE